MPRDIPVNELDHVEQYMVIEISYSDTIILPYQDGIKFLASIEKAEQLTGTMSSITDGKIKFDPKRCVAFDMATIPQRIYRDAKMDLLLGLEPKPDDEDHD